MPYLNRRRKKYIRITGNQCKRISRLQTNPLIDHQTKMKWYGHALRTNTLGLPTSVLPFLALPSR